MKTVTSLLFVLMLTFAAFGQAETSLSRKKDKPDFSGTWILDRTKTKKVDYDLTLIVVHREPELKVTGKFDSKGVKKTEERIYFTDGRRTPDVRTDYFDCSHETRWAGRNIFHKIIESSIGGGDERFKTEEWKLSKDGKDLIITLTEGYSMPRSQESITANGSLAGDSLRRGGFMQVLKFKRGGGEF